MRSSSGPSSRRKGDDGRSRTTERGTVCAKMRAPLRFASRREPRKTSHPRLHETSLRFSRLPSRAVDCRAPLRAPGRAEAGNPPAAFGPHPRLFSWSPANVAAFTANAKQMGRSSAASIVKVACQDTIDNPKGYTMRGGSDGDNWPGSAVSCALRSSGHAEARVPHTGHRVLAGLSRRRSGPGRQARVRRPASTRAGRAGTVTPQRPR